MATTEREAIKALLADTLALRLADELGRHKLPEEAAMSPLRSAVSDSAEIVLANFEKQLAVTSISEAVIDRLRGDLVRRSRVSGLIEIGINVGALLLGVLASAIVVFLDPAANAAVVKVLAVGIAAIVLLQFLGNMYLRHFDHAR